MVSHPLRDDGTDHLRVKQQIFMAWFLNMDAQDAQDNQDGTLLHERLTPAVIACGFADVQDYKPAVSRKYPVHPVHPCK